jgi:nucleotide-binding universal stress UspA family protein
VHRIVLGYDGSPPARKAVRFLERMELPAGAHVRLIHAIEPFSLPSGTPVAYREMALKEAHTINERQHRRAAEGLQAVAALLGRTGSARVQPDVEAGDAATVLLEASRKEHADLLVVGSRKPSAVRHYLLGSTAEKLVRHADASVLVVR